MRDPNRITPALEELGRIWRRHPDLRLGQLLHVAGVHVKPGVDLFYVEDDALLAGLRRFEEENCTPDPLYREQVIEEKQNWPEPLVALDVYITRDEEGDFMAFEANFNMSAFGDSPSEALRELATVIELYREEIIEEERKE